MRGVIVRIDADGKFGFIEGVDGREFFFHLTGLSGVDFDQLAVGSKVEFSVREHEPGDEPGEHPRAVHVQLAPEQVPVIENEPLPPEKLD
jgi:cold shock CspA family protein